MCYSAKVWADYRKYVRAYGAEIGIEAFERLYGLRAQGVKVNIPRAMDAAFAEPRTAAEKAIKALIDAHDAGEVVRLEQELFAQRKRLADAERKLALKATRAAQESRRIATAKVEWLLSRLAALKRSAVADEEARIFPGWQVPVMVENAGRRLILPMRYQCRPAGKPASYDRRYPGTYNARRDNLRGFWAGQFGHTHAIVVASAFYENVALHAAEQRELRAGETEQNVVLEFRPQPAHDMQIACLWSHWSGAGETLDSFAAITDEPPPEVRAAGHDRCIIPIRSENLDAWLNPQASDATRWQAILDERERPYYAHRQAA